MIECKFRYKGEENFNYKDFKSEEEMKKFLEDDPKEIEEYDSRKKEINNPFKKWFINLKNTKQNWKKVKSSPYASLVLALKARKIIVACLIPFLIYMGIDMILKVKTLGIMGVVVRLVQGGVMLFIIWKIYSTIPQAKKQIEYYKKYPHTINYVPTDTKQTVDDILNKIKSNQIKSEEVKNNATRNEKKGKERRT